MKAVVMAGGFGTRIQPLPNFYPKPMLPIVNRPMMEHIINKLKSVGISEIVILLYFKPEIIKDYFKDGSEFGVKINYVLPEDDYGTAGAVKCAQEFLNETFIIVSGDLVTDFDFKKIIDFHQSKASKLTITLTPVEDPLQFGVVITDQHGKIQKFLEKPSWGEVFSDTINTGIYILEPEILNYIPKDENYDFGKELFPTLMKENITLWGSIQEGYWRDVGNPQSYREVYEDILNQKVNFEFNGKKQNFEEGVAYVENKTKLPNDLKVKGIVVIGKNVTIGNEVELSNAVIGDNCIIEEKTKISDSVLWHNVIIESRSNINNAVICNGNKIGKKVKAKSGIIMAENCEIGKNVTFEKDVIIWPDKIIDENSIVSNNVIWGTKYKSTIFENGSVIGRTNIELSCEMATKLAESFGSMLPVGSSVFVSRDYHKSSRMLKRAFLGGLLSTGINVVDVTHSPSNVMRFNLATDEDIVAGIHFRQSVSDQINTEIIFFTGEGITIDTNTAKSIERIFFRESFRRVNHNEIGEITESYDLKARYKAKILGLLNKNEIKQKELKIVANLMFGSTANVYPDVVNDLQIDNVILNAYPDDKKLSKISTLITQSENEVSAIVKSLNFNVGFLIYPNGQRLEIVSEDGKVLDNHISLLTMLSLLNLNKNKKTKVFLPAWAPDFVDTYFENLTIKRDKFGNFKASFLREFDFIGNTNGNYTFTEFALNTDAVYASLKMVEMMAINEAKISKLLEKIPDFYYLETTVDCPSNLKGKMMRKFLEDSKDKESSHLDGVKIWVAKNDWVLMIPDQHADNLNLYIQAKDNKRGSEILKEYSEKIQKWIQE